MRETGEISSFGRVVGNTNGAVDVGNGIGFMIATSLSTGEGFPTGILGIMSLTQ